MLTRRQQIKAWYDSARWQHRRARQLADEPLCRMCLTIRERITAASVADHVVPHRGNAEAFWHGELQSLCVDCHNGWKQRLEHGGSINGNDASGQPIDPNHPWNRKG